MHSDIDTRCVQEVLRLKLYLPKQKGRKNETLIFVKIVTVSFPFLKATLKLLC